MRNSIEFSEHTWIQPIAKYMNYSKFNGLNSNVTELFDYIEDWMNLNVTPE